MPGSSLAYVRNPDYVPVSSGTPSMTAGPKVVHFDRVEWRIIPDASTAAAALQNGEIDWWEQPTADLFPLVARNRNINVDVINGTGLIGIFRPNHLTAPFNNPAVRRAVITAVNQMDFMTAVIGEATVPGYATLRRENIGYFAPELALRLDGRAGPAEEVDRRRAGRTAGRRRDGRQAGAAERDGSLLDQRRGAGGCGPVPPHGLRRGPGERRLGHGGVAPRLSKNPLEQGGWSGFFTFWSGVDHWNPASHASIRGHGDAAWPGWPTIPAIEAQRNAWFDAPNEAAAKAATTEMQRIAFDQVPYVPTGMYYQPTAYRRNLTGMLKGQPPLFWNLRRG